MAEKKEVINLKEMASKNNSIKENSTSLFNKLGETSVVHGFKNSIKVNTYNNPIDSIEDLLHEDKPSYIRVPLGVSFTSLKYSLEEVEKMILENEKINIKAKRLKYKINELDIQINPSLKQEFKEEVEGEASPIIKSLKMTKDGKVYLVLDSKIFIVPQKTVSNLSALVDNFQSSIRKDILPDELLRLRSDYFLIQQDLNNLVIGRIDKELVMEISLQEILKKLIIPRIILSKGSTPDMLNDVVAASNRAKYRGQIKVNSSFDFKHSLFYFVVESESSIPSLEMVINKSNFVCLNISYTNELLKEFIKNRVLEYLVENEEAIENDSNYLETINNLDLNVRMVPLSNLSKQVSAVRGLPITEMIKVTKHNIPLYIPVLEMNIENFIDKNLNPIFNSFGFKDIIRKKPSSKIINEIFGKWIASHDPYISSFGGDDKMALILDPKRLILSLFLDYNDKFSDYAISLNTKESMSSFSIQII